MTKHNISKDGYQYYNGFYIIEYQKQVFGKSRTAYRVEQYDVVMFSSSDLDECYIFCDNFTKVFNSSSRIL